LILLKDKPRQPLPQAPIAQVTPKAIPAPFPDHFWRPWNHCYGGGGTGSGGNSRSLGDDQLHFDPAVQRNRNEHREPFVGLGLGLRPRRRDDQRHGADRQGTPSIAPRPVRNPAGALPHRGGKNPRYYRKAPDAPEALLLTVDDAFLRAVDEWRRRQPGVIPNQSEAIAGSRMSERAQARAFAVLVLKPENFVSRQFSRRRARCRCHAERPAKCQVGATR
jgi:hypothetical protein